MTAEELARLCGGPVGRTPMDPALPGLESRPDWLEAELDPRGPRRRLWEDLAGQLDRGSLRLVRPGDAAYPPLLEVMGAPPDPLFLKGRPELAAREAVALVGTREPDARGLAWTARMSSLLARGGLVVVSGGAAGVDGQAHRHAGAASTIAVLGAGFDRPYPGGHRRLFEEIAQEGLLISEWPPWTRPDSWRFPRRNRVIAGLSRAVLVAQAPRRSGALNTARHAVEEGREVWACPGPWEEPLYAGCHHLIRQGARLVAGEEDLLAELGELPFLGYRADLLSTTATPRQAPAATEGDSGLWQALEHPLSRDELVLRLGLEPGELAARLVEEELAGRLRSLPGDRWARCNWSGA